MFLIYVVDLLSPFYFSSSLMGPVTAIAYGISIGDFKMVRMGLVTEVVSLIICIVIGLIFGASMIQFKIAEFWPGTEMTSRGTWTNFYVGIPVAFFSGLGVAVGLLDSQTNSLVGVAISASLLPPAVNAGMLWIIGLREDAEDMGHVQMGVISLSLTIINIIFIIIASMLMFRLKEVRFNKVVGVNSILNSVINHFFNFLIYSLTMRTHCWLHNITFTDTPH